MRVVVGLGNPGSEYAETRHNIGFMVVDELCRRHGAVLGKERRGSRVARASLGAESVILVQPQTFMNCSGDSLARLDADLRPAPADLVVVHDELDVPLGRVALKRGGGTGGHRGLESVVRWAGPDFVRVRVGIGRPPTGRDVSDYVLRRFRDHERVVVAECVARAAEAVEAIVRDGLDRAMNSFNSMPAVTTRTGECS